MERFIYPALLSLITGTMVGVEIAEYKGWDIWTALFFGSLRDTLLTWGIIEYITHNIQ